jgi:hypothetical protein
MRYEPETRCPRPSMHPAGLGKLLHRARARTLTSARREHADRARRGLRLSASTIRWLVLLIESGLPRLAGPSRHAREAEIRRSQHWLESALPSRDAREGSAHLRRKPRRSQPELRRAVREQGDQRRNVGYRSRASGLSYVAEIRAQRNVASTSITRAGFVSGFTKARRSTVRSCHLVGTHRITPLFASALDQTA